MEVYLEQITFKCHKTDDGIRIPIEEEFFNGKCDAFIEGFRLKPEGETWVREDGQVFSGPKMITPWKDATELDSAQREYERQMLAEYESALAEIEAALGV